jgi:hypothetical protein
VNALDERVRRSFISANIPTEPVDELLQAFPQAKRRFYRTVFRPRRSRELSW